MSNKNISCPRCGSTMIYVGLYAIECGESKSCPFWTKKQSLYVEEYKNSIKQKELENKKITEKEYDDDSYDKYSEYLNYYQDD